MAKMDESALLCATRHQLSGNDGNTARVGLRPDARIAEHSWFRADAKCDASERDARGTCRGPRISWRMAVLNHRHGQAVGDRTMGLAIQRASRHRQFLRLRRSGGDDTA